MEKSRQRKRKRLGALSNGEASTVRTVNAGGHGAIMKEVLLGLLISVIIGGVVLLYWNSGNKQQYHAQETNFPGQERTFDKKGNNKRQTDHLSKQSVQRSVSLAEEYDSIAEGIDKDMLPREPSEDPMDFNDHAAFNSLQQEQVHPSDDKGSMHPPDYLKRNWWVDVIEKIKDREHIKLHSDPDVYEVPNFLTSGECYELIKVYERLNRQKIEEPSWCFSDEEWLDEVMHGSKINEYEVERWYAEKLGHACVQGARVNSAFSQQLKFSSAVLVPRGEDSFVDEVELKVAQLGLPTENAYHTQLLKYKGGEQYHTHTDCHREFNDRMGTILIYLNDVKEGGETVFPALNISIVPKRGKAIIWKSLDNDGSCNKRTLHASAVLKSGLKTVYQKWFHQTQLLPQYDPDCVLCDSSHSCREYIHSPETRQATAKMQEADRYVSSKQFKKALKLYQEAIEIQQNHSMSLVYGADVLMRLQRKHEALHWFQKALKLHPKHVDSNFIMSNILQEQNKLQLAVKHLEVVVEMAPKDVDAFFNLGAMYAELGKTSEAATILQKVVNLSPNDAEAHGELGAVLSDLGKEAEAEAHFAKAKELQKQRRRKQKGQ